MNPPLSFRASARPLKPKDIKELAKEAGIAPEPSKGIEWDLPFFSTQVRLAELVIESVIPAARHYVLIEGEDKAQKMSFAPGFVEALAVRRGLSLTRDNADEYIRFYMGFTRGQGGRVMPIDSVDDLPLREELTLITRRNLQSLITPIVVHDENTVSGCFLIGNKLFSARADIKASGMVTLEPLGLLADTLPVNEYTLEL